jgi:hypothetical protein
VSIEGEEAGMMQKPMKNAKLHTIDLMAAWGKEFWGENPGGADGRGRSPTHD